MKAKFVFETLQEAYEPKDLKRVQDFAKKSGGDLQKEIALAERMAKTLTSMNKAIGRAEAAAEVYGGWNEIVEVFYNKAKELGYTGPPPGERLEKGPVLGSQLPREQQYSIKRPKGPGFRGPNNRFGRGGSWHGKSILPIGKVDLRTGDSKFFNIYDKTDSTIEVWRDNKGIDTTHIDKPIEPHQTGIGSILKPKGKEEIDKEKRKYFNYKIVITSGSNPLHQIGDFDSFHHDQNGGNIGHWEMVDYVSLENARELSLSYGGKLSGYVYK